MISTQQVDQIVGGNVVGQDGGKIGKVTGIYFDDKTDTPEWAAVTTGLFGSKESLVPLADAQWAGDSLTVPFDKDRVKDAPNLDPDQELSQSDEAELYRYYGMEYTESASDSGLPAGGTSSPSGSGERPNAGRADLAGEPGIVGQDTSGPTTDSAMTRSEERLNVGTEKVQTGKARLRKRIVTENVQTSVPVSREEVRVTSEPITDANRDAAYSGGDLTEEDHEVVLTEERPVVNKETVAVERVKMDKETSTDNVQVSEQVRKEEINVDQGTETDSRR